MESQKIVGGLLPQGPPTRRGLLPQGPPTRRGLLPQGPVLPGEGSSGACSVFPACGCGRGLVAHICFRGGGESGVGASPRILALRTIFTFWSR